MISQTFPTSALTGHDAGVGWRGMKQVLVMMAAVVLVGCGTTKVDPNAPANIADPIVEKAVRKSLEKPEGKLTEADLAKVTRLGLWSTKITDEGLKEVVKLQKLDTLRLYGTQITDVGLAELKKALPNCEIYGP